MSETRSFTCQTCADDNKFLELSTVDKFKEHMTTVHGITKLCGKKEMISYLDGRDWYGITNRWTFGDVVVIESYRCARDKNDPMRGDEE